MGLGLIYEIQRKQENCLKIRKNLLKDSKKLKKLNKVPKLLIGLQVVSLDEVLWEGSEQRELEWVQVE